LTLGGDIFDNILDHSRINSICKDDSQFHLRRDDNFSDPSSISS